MFWYWHICETVSCGTKSYQLWQFQVNLFDLFAKPVFVWRRRSGSRSFFGGSSSCYAQTEVLRTYGLLLPTHWGVIHWRTEHMHMVGSTKTYIFIDAEVSLRKWKTWYIETKTMKKVRSRYIVNIIMGILSWRYWLKQYASIMSKMRWSA